MCFIIGALLFPAVALAAEKFPSRPITIIVPFTPGGTWDIIGRLFAEDWRLEFGVPTEVKNLPGASGRIALMELLKSKPDGYTVAEVNTGAVVEQLIRENPPYDLKRDTLPVANFSGTPYGLVVRSDSPFKSYKDIVNYARQNPGVLKYSVPGIYLPQNLAMIAIAAFEKISWKAVPVKGNPEAFAALMGGHVPLYSGYLGAVAQDPSKSRIIVAYGRKRLPEYPDVPTLLDVGVPSEYVMPRYWGGLFVPKGTPKERIKILDQAVQKTLKKPHFVEKLKFLYETSDYMNAEDTMKAVEEFTHYQKRIIDLMKKEDKKE